MMFGRFGWAEILVIVVLVVILFGSNKIPGMMKNLADGLNVFKKEIKEVKQPVKKTTVKKAPAKKAAKKK
jgi:sec-independent protein translocase protein TatA